MDMNTQPSGPKANAYATLEEIDGILSSLPTSTTDWDSAADATKQKAIIHATTLIDSLYNFKGAPYSVYQVLKWPRVVDEDVLGGPRQPTYKSVWSKKITPTWVQSPAVSGEYYLDGGDSDIAYVEEFAFDGLLYPASTVGSLSIGSYGIGDNDTLGYDTVYMVAHKRVFPSLFEGDVYLGTFIEEASGFDLKDFIYVPLFIKKAVAELCKVIVTNDVTSNDISDYNNIRVGPISISPRKSVKEINIPDVVSKLLRPYGIPISGNVVEIGRG